jgi:isopentenyl-diphosphate delta-isomerase
MGPSYVNLWHKEPATRMKLTYNNLMIVMFVCAGNTYRGRLAEAYLKSLAIPGVVVESAGVSVDDKINGRINDYTKQLQVEFGLEPYSKLTWDSLKQSRLNRADIVICMNRSVYQSAEAAGFKLPLRTFIWSITDVSNLVAQGTTVDAKIPHVARQTYLRIIEQVNDLTTYLRRPAPKEMIDVLLPDGSVTGRTADVDEIHTKGLWHQGIHAIIYTDAGEALFEKRSTSIINNPGLWDLTMGGISGAGEDPDTTLVRELKEELGIKVEQSAVNKLFVWRYNHYLPHYGLHNRSLIHTYAVGVGKLPALKLQRSEVDTVKLLSFRQAADFINSGDSSLGKSITSPHYYNRLLQAAVREHSLRAHTGARA